MGNCQALVTLSPVFGYEAMMDKERKRFLKKVGKDKTI